MTKKIIYFTAGPLPTVEEAADIAKLNAVTEAPYSVAVRNSQVPLSSGGPTEDCDFVAGSIPAPYDNDDEEEGKIYPEIDPDDIPTVALSATQAVVSDGQTLLGYTFTVVDSVITAISPE